MPTRGAQRKDDSDGNEVQEIRNPKLVAHVWRTATEKRSSSAGMRYSVLQLE